MSNQNLSDVHCKPCNGEVPPLSPGNVADFLVKLDDEWAVAADGKSIIRRFKFKGFAKAVQMANLCAWLADREGHHPDIAFGWGYCQVTLTTHDIDGLSENDFIWATRLDALLK